MITADEVDTAVDNVIAVSQEWAGEGIVPKLACFGFQFPAISKLIRRRWRDYEDGCATKEDAFTKGYAEALMVGKQL